MEKVLLIILIFAASLFASDKDYFQQAVDYRIQVALDAKEKTYEGTETIKYINHSPDQLAFIWMHLYPNAYKNTSTPYARQKEKRGSSSFYFSKEKDRGYLDVTSLKSAGQDLSFAFKEDAIDEIKIDLNTPLNPGDTLVLDLSFNGKFPKVFSRMGVFEENHFAATQWYPKIVVYDRYGWHPDSYLDQGEFYGEYGRFDVSITLPASFVIDATGMLQNNPAEEAFNNKIIDSTKTLLALENKKDRKKWIKDWQEGQPDSVNYDSTKTVRFVAENVHDFAWFTGPDYLILRKVHNNNVLTNVLTMPENAYDWRNVPDYVDRTISFYSKNVGPYQYPKASVIDGAMSAGGGMEYPMITIVSISATDWNNILEIAVMHEVGHNWYMGMVGSDERASTFLDEGLNSFLEFKYMEHHYGPKNMTRFKKLTWGLDIFNDVGEWDMQHLVYGMAVSTRTDQPLNLRASAFSPFNYGAINYQKGVALLYTLEWYLGADLFNKGMHTYFERWNGKHPGVKDYFDTMAQVSGKDLDWFVNEWYNSTHSNDFKITRTQTEKTGQNYTTRVWLKNNGDMVQMPAPVQLVTVSGDTLEERWVGDENESVSFSHSGPVKRVEVNLKRDIFESNYLNNASGLPEFEINFIPQLPSFDKYQLNFFPSYWYDGVNDKSRVGILTWTGNLITNQWFSIGNYNYGTATGKSHYRYKLSNRFYFPFANFSDISAEIRDKEGLRRYSLEISNHIKKREAHVHKISFYLTLDVLDLYDQKYNDINFYETARYTALTASVKTSDKQMLSRWNVRLDVEKSLKLFNGDNDYFKMSLEGKYTYKLGRKTSTSLHLYSGYLSAGQAPIQESIFAAGDLDPKQKSFAILRTGSLAPLRGFSFNRGMNMYGYNSSKNKFFNGRIGASLSMDVKLPYYLPVLYVTGASLADKPSRFAKQDSYFAEAGIKVNASGLNIILPIYLTHPYAGEKHVAFRWLISWGIGFSLGV